MFRALKNEADTNTDEIGDVVTGDQRIDTDKDGNIDITLDPVADVGDDLEEATELEVEADEIDYSVDEQFDVAEEALMLASAMEAVGFSPIALQLIRSQELRTETSVIALESITTSLEASHPDVVNAVENLVMTAAKAIAKVASDAFSWAAKKVAGLGSRIGGLKTKLANLKSIKGDKIKAGEPSAIKAAISKRIDALKAVIKRITDKVSGIDKDYKSGVAAMHKAYSKAGPLGPYGGLTPAQRKKSTRIGAATIRPVMLTVESVKAVASELGGMLSTMWGMIKGLGGSIRSTIASIGKAGGNGVSTAARAVWAAGKEAYAIVAGAVADIAKWIRSVGGSADDTRLANIAARTANAS